METNKSCCGVWKRKRWICVIKSVHGFIFLPERTFYSIFMLLMLICMEHKIWFFFLHFSTNRRKFSITTRNSLFSYFPSSEFKSVINYIDAIWEISVVWCFRSVLVFAFAPAFGLISKSSSAFGSGLKGEGFRNENFIKLLSQMWWNGNFSLNFL